MSEKIEMLSLDQQLKQSLDVSNFKMLTENAEKPVSNEAELKAAHEAAFRTQIDQIQEYAKINPNGPLANANRALLAQGNSVETWIAGPGDFSLAGTYAWALGGGVPFPGMLPLGFLYGGTGESWKAWGAGTCVILGSFVQNPNTICLSNDFHEEDTPVGKIRKGFCKFTASGGGLGISGVTISFYSTSGTFWGTLTGSGLFGGFFSIEGQLELVWQGWRRG